MQAAIVNFFKQRLQPPEIKYKYNYSIEQYRGLCALLVLLTHAVGDPKLLVDNFSWPLFMQYMGAGYLSVMVFFCMSGYVIGITSSSSFSIKSYLKKRALRLYPIYIISIVICIIVAGRVSLTVLLGNLLFLQNGLPYYHFKIPVLVNYATWSLNYEVLYYLLFIPLIVFKPRLWMLLLPMFVMSIMSIHITEPFYFMGCYFNGFYFWLLGLILSWNLISKQPAAPKNIVPFISIIFLHLSLNHLGMGQIILHTIGIYTHSNLNWVFDLPFCLMVMSTLTRRDNRLLQYNKLVTYTLPVCVFIYLVITKRIFEDTRWVMCLIYWVLSLLFYFETRISAFIMNKFTGIAKISYGLYILHVPIALLIKKYIIIHNQLAEVTLKYLLWLILTFSLAYWLELHFQPAVRRYFTKNEKDTRLFQNPAA